MVEVSLWKWPSRWEYSKLLWEFVEWKCRGILDEGLDEWRLHIYVRFVHFSVCLSTASTYQAILVLRTHGLRNLNHDVCGLRWYRDSFRMLPLNTTSACAEAAGTFVEMKEESWPGLFLYAGCVV